MIGNIRGIIDKVTRRKLGVTAVAGAAAAAGAVDIPWPIAAIAMAYIAGQTVVDASRRGSVVGLRVRPVISICFDLDVPKDSALPLLPDSVKALMAAPCGVTRSYGC